MAYVKRLKDLTSYGIIYDRDGDMLFEENLKNFSLKYLKEINELIFQKI